MFWALSLVVLVGGAMVVCPDGQCALNDSDRSGLSLAHALRSEWLDRLGCGLACPDPRRTADYAKVKQP